MFSEIIDGIAVVNNIPRGTVYKSKKYGVLSPDSRYIEDGLYPQYGKEPPCDKQIQTISGPEFTFNGVDQVNLIWTVTDKPVEQIRAEIQKQNKDACRQFIYNRYPIEMQLNGGAGTLDAQKTIDMTDHILRIRKEENRVYDLIEVSNDPVNIKAPVWPEV